MTFVVYRITGQGPHNRIRERLVHASKLKPYIPPYVEPYLMNDQTASAPEAASSPDALGSVLPVCPTASADPELPSPGLGSSRPQRARRPPDYLADYYLSE